MIETIQNFFTNTVMTVKLLFPLCLIFTIFALVYSIDEIKQNDNEPGLWTSGFVVGFFLTFITGRILYKTYKKEKKIARDYIKNMNTHNQRLNKYMDQLQTKSPKEILAE